jgi:hypothetical protein
MYEIGECGTKYTDNRCEKETRVPGMYEDCAEWERCMEKDPARIARFPLLAETLGEVVNEVVEPLSLKAMLFIGVLVLAGAYVIVVGLPKMVQKRNESREEVVRLDDLKYWRIKDEERRRMYWDGNDRRISYR